MILGGSEQLKSVHCLLSCRPEPGFSSWTCVAVAAVQHPHLACVHHVGLGPVGERRSQDTALAASRDTMCTAVCVGRVSSGAWAERPAGCLRGAPLEEADAKRPEQSPAQHRQSLSEHKRDRVFKGPSDEAR